MKTKPHSFCSSCFHSAIMWWSIPSRYTRICSTRAVLLSWSSPTALSSCSTSFCPCSPSNFPTRKIRQSGKICSGLTNTQVTRYCSDDSVNLILSLTGIRVCMDSSLRMVSSDFRLRCKKWLHGKTREAIFLILYPFFIWIP